MDWESDNLLLIKSSRDAMNTLVNLVIDPAIFVEDNQSYLLPSQR